MVTTETTRVRTRGQGDVHDLTAEATRAASSSGFSSGIVVVFVVGSTAGVTTIECEPGAVSDLDAAFELSRLLGPIVFDAGPDLTPA